MRTPLVYLLLLALAIALGLAFLFGVGRGDEPALRSAAEVSPVSAPPGPDPSASALAVETATATAARESAAPAPPVAPVAEPAEAPASKTDATVVVHVVSKMTRAPLAGIRVSLFRTEPVEGENAADVPGTKGSLTETPITTEEGLVEFAAPSGVACTAWAYALHDEAGSSNASLPALRPGERRELTLELPTGIDLHFVARVIADADGNPIAGARARVIRSQGTFTSKGDRFWSSQTLSETSTDANGMLEVSLQSWRLAHIRVEAEGFGLTLLAPAPGHETQGTALRVPLLRGATLDARVLDAAGAPLHDASLRLSTRGYELNRPRREDSDTGWVDLPDETRTEAVGPDGRVVLRDLAPEVQLQVEILSDVKVLRPEADPLVLQPGQVLEREWRIGAGATLVGLVIDQADHPVAGLELWLTKSFSELPRYFDPHEGSEAIAKAVTDAEGRFLLADVAAGKWSLGPAASDRVAIGGIPSSSQRAPEDEIAPIATRIEVTGSGRQEVTLRVHRGLFIRGKVLDSHGDPAASTNVHAAMEGADWGPQADSEKDGSFALGPLAPGRFRLEAASQGNDASSDTVSAETGETGVVLRLREGGKLHGRVIDSRTSEGCSAEMLVMPESPRPGIFGGGVGFGNHTDGSFEMEGLEPGRYGVSARTEDGRFGVVSGVGLAAGSGSDAVTVTVSPGGKLKLRYEGAREHVFVWIRLSGVPIEWPVHLERGKTVEKPAPAGTLVLETDAQRGGKPLSGTVVLASGEEKEYVFRDGE